MSEENTARGAKAVRALSSRCYSHNRKNAFLTRRVGWSRSRGRPLSAAPIVLPLAGRPTSILPCRARKPPHRRVLQRLPCYSGSQSTHAGGGYVARPPLSEDQLGLLQGTLDMLILQTLRQGPAHGHQIAITIERTSSSPDRRR